MTPALSGWQAQAAEAPGARGPGYSKCESDAAQDRTVARRSAKLRVSCTSRLGRNRDMKVMTGIIKFKFSVNDSESHHLGSLSRDRLGWGRSTVTVTAEKKQIRGDVVMLSLE